MAIADRLSSRCSVASGAAAEEELRQRRDDALARFSIASEVAEPPRGDDAHARDNDRSVAKSSNGPAPQDIGGSEDESLAARVAALRVASELYLSLLDAETARESAEEPANEPAEDLAVATSRLRETEEALLPLVERIEVASRDGKCHREVR